MTNEHMKTLLMILAEKVETLEEEISEKEFVIAQLQRKIDEYRGTGWHHEQGE